MAVSRECVVFSSFVGHDGVTPYSIVVTDKVGELNSSGFLVQDTTVVATEQGELPITEGFKFLEKNKKITVETGKDPGIAIQIVLRS